MKLRIMAAVVAAMMFLGVGEAQASWGDETEGADRYDEYCPSWW